jgi:hypothetical protein
MNPKQAAMTLAETVKTEALAEGYRRETARQDRGNIAERLLGPGAGAYDAGDRVRQIAARLREADAEARRLELARRIATPSGLIATMKADWPMQSKAVKAFAEANGLPLGEAWATVIATAVQSLEGADE